MVGPLLCVLFVSGLVKTHGKERRQAAFNEMPFVSLCLQVFALLCLQVIAVLRLFAAVLPCLLVLSVYLYYSCSNACSR